MIGRLGTLWLALRSTVLSQLIAISTVSAHGGADSSVVQRYDELLIVTAVPVVLMLVGGLLHRALPVRRDDRRRETRSTALLVGRAVQPSTRARNR